MMRKFEKLTSRIAPISAAEIDTDVILPARFLLYPIKKGLGAYAFCDQRRAGQKPVFVLDRPEFSDAQILLTGPKFGVGSSREHAVWAIADLGIRVIIAPSFGEIFFANCFNNGILAIEATADMYRDLSVLAETGAEISIDLAKQEIRSEQDSVWSFEIETHNKRALLLGQDKIDIVLAEDLDEIQAFEIQHHHDRPWLILSEQQSDFLNTQAPAPRRQN